MCKRGAHKAPHSRLFEIASRNRLGRREEDQTEEKTIRYITPGKSHPADCFRPGSFGVFGVASRGTYRKRHGGLLSPDMAFRGGLGSRPPWLDGPATNGEARQGRNNHRVLSACRRVLPLIRSPPPPRSFALELELQIAPALYVIWVLVGLLQI